MSCLHSNLCLLPWHRHKLMFLLLFPPFCSPSVTRWAWMWGSPGLRGSTLSFSALKHEPRFGGSLIMSSLVDVGGEKDQRCFFPRRCGRPGGAYVCRCERVGRRACQSQQLASRWHSERGFSLYLPMNVLRGSRSRLRNNAPVASAAPEDPRWACL